MKQHLEELIKKAEASWEGCHGCDEYDREFWINGYITGTLANQVELPSNEDIEKGVDDWVFKTSENKWPFIQGAKWMKEQILNQNK